MTHNTLRIANISRSPVKFMLGLDILANFFVAVEAQTALGLFVKGLMTIFAFAFVFRMAFDERTGHD